MVGIRPRQPCAVRVIMPGVVSAKCIHDISQKWYHGIVDFVPILWNMERKMMTISENLEGIEQRISDACRRCGRDRCEVTLVGVSKKKPVTAIVEALETTSLRDFGENYVQEYVEKRAMLGDAKGVRFHLIGHLQRNKVRQLMSCPPDLIHSVDSLALARQIEQVTAELYPTRRQAILIELRIGDEDGEKTGLPVGQLEALVEFVDSCAHLELKGLMLIPPASEDPEAARPYFRQVRELLMRLNEHRARRLEILSYGMSHDFEVAIEEGATHVRIGTAIFGARS